MWIVYEQHDNNCMKMVNADKLVHIWQRNKFIYLELVFEAEIEGDYILVECADKDEAAYVIGRIKYGMGVGEFTVDIPDTIKIYRRLQDKKKQMEVM